MSLRMSLCMSLFISTSVIFITATSVLSGEQKCSRAPMTNGLRVDPSIGTRHSLSPNLDVVGGAEDVGFKLKDRFGHIFSLIGWRASVRSRVSLTNKIPNLAHSESDDIYIKKKKVQKSTRSQP